MPYIASMGIYVVSKHVMLDLLRDKFPGANDFGSEVIPGATELGLRVRFPSTCSICNEHYCFLRIIAYSRCKLIYTMDTGKTLVQLRLSIMQIWESPKSLCQILGNLMLAFKLFILPSTLF